MALLRDIIYKRGLPLSKIIKLEFDKVSLKPVKKIEIKFDPFSENVKSIREFSHLLHSNSVLQTNSKCLIKTQITTDRSESSATFSLNNGQDVVIKCDNLSCLEIVRLFNKFITPLDPKEDLSNILESKQKLKKKK